MLDEEDAALIAPEFAIRLNALQLLLNAGADVQDSAQIIRVDDGAISYLDSIRRPMTAWTRQVGAAVRVALEVGWSAEPSATSQRTLEQPSGGLVLPGQIESD